MQQLFEDQGKETQPGHISPTLEAEIKKTKDQQVPETNKPVHSKPIPVHPDPELIPEQTKPKPVPEQTKPSKLSPDQVSSKPSTKPDPKPTVPYTDQQPQPIAKPVPEPQSNLPVHETPKIEPKRSVKPEPEPVPQQSKQGSGTEHKPSDRTTTTKKETTVTPKVK